MNNNYEESLYTKDKEDKTMAILAKPCNKMISVDAKSSPEFIERFNQNTISSEKLASCKKAMRLFAQNGRKSK